MGAGDTDAVGGAQETGVPVDEIWRKQAPAQQVASAVDVLQDQAE